MIAFDTSRLPDSIPGWTALLDMIEETDSDAEVERTWLELKSLPDLDNAHHKFTVAKAILGMANRDPGRAQEFLGGNGLIVVGAAAGNLTGTQQIEDHVLQDKLAPYLGDTGRSPAFDTKWVSRDGNSILIIIVASPSDGDPIYPLRKEYDRSPPGVVFTRPSTKTAPADAAGMDMLSRRLITRQAPFDVSATLGPDTLRTYTYDMGAITRRLNHFRELCLAGAPHPEPSSSPTSSLAKAIEGLADGVRAQNQRTERFKKSLAAYNVYQSELLDENRTPDAYRSQIDAYFNAIQDVLPKIIDDIIALTQPPSTITIHNNSGRYLEDVEACIHISGSIHTADSTEITVFHLLLDRFPPRVRPWGPRPNPERFPAPRPIITNAAPNYSRPQEQGLSGIRFNTSGSVDVTANLKELRPYASHTLNSSPGGTVFVVTDPELIDTAVKLETTAKGIDGICKHAFTHPVSPPVDITSHIDDALTSFYQQHAD